MNRPTPGAPNQAAEMGSPWDLRINEWLADPPSGGEDWMELYNSGRRPVALAGLHLTDDLANPKRFAIPPLSFIGVGPSAYQVFVADNDETAGPNHLTFKLSGGGESIGLADPEGFFIDSVVFGAQEPGVSEGRFPDGASDITTFPANPTPGRRNTPQPAPDVALWLLPTQQVLMAWPSTPGDVFWIESTDSLMRPQWEVVGTVTATDTETTFQTGPGRTAAQYYRVLVMP